MSRCVHIFVHPDYPLSVVKITVPLIEAYAESIGAAVNHIRGRKFPGFPPGCERFQIYEAGKDFDWNACIDATTLIGRGLAAFDSYIKPQSVGLCVKYAASFLLNVSDNIYFQRDGRDFGVIEDFVVTSKFTHDLWQPPRGSQKNYRHIALDGNHERIASFCISENLARFALKVESLFPGVGHPLHRLLVQDRRENELLAEIEDKMAAFEGRQLPARPSQPAPIPAPQPQKPVTSPLPPQGVPESRLDMRFFSGKMKALIADCRLEEIIKAGSARRIELSAVLAASGLPVASVDAACCNQDAPQENALTGLIDNDRRQLVFLDSSAGAGLPGFREFMKLRPSRLRSKVLVFDGANQVAHSGSAVELQRRGYPVEFSPDGHLAWCVFRKDPAR